MGNWEKVNIAWALNDSNELGLIWLSMDNGIMALLKTNPDFRVKGNEGWVCCEIIQQKEREG